MIKKLKILQILIIALFIIVISPLQKTIALETISNADTEEIDPSPDLIFTENNNSKSTTNKTNFFVLNNNKFQVNYNEQNSSYIEDDNNGHKIIRLGISNNSGPFEDIFLEKTTNPVDSIDEINFLLSSKDPSKEIEPLIFKEKEVSEKTNRLKTVYFLTSLSTGIGQSTQIEDSFTKGKTLTGGGKTLNHYYGYQNVVQNLVNPFSRAVKGAQVDDSGNMVNFTLHPLFGIGVISYLTASGASAKEAFATTLADNFIFEYLIEGTYVAPSGIDLLTTSGGCVIGYFVSKYLFKKPFQKIIKKSAYLKNKYGIYFDPIIEPGQMGKGMRVGSQVTIKH
jgi:hypothetical protein